MFKKSLYLAICGTILSASTTMCYKKNHIDPSTIETIALDGGKCEGKLSAKDMQRDGYIVDTMKIQNTDDGLSYIYIFKKQKNISVSTSTLKDQLKQIAKDDKKQKKIDDKKTSIEDGKKIYQQCIQCHGEKGEIEAYNSSRKLNSLTLEDMESSVRDYGLSEKDNGFAMIMIPYSDSLTSKDIKKVYDYLQSLK